jgi:23S rRNA (guanosine2251-2'-O)-methyltransferase
MPRHIDPAGLVGGINAVEALIRKEPRRIRSLVLQKDGSNQRLHSLQRLAEAAGIRARQLSKPELDAFYEGHHEGVLAFCETRSLEEWEVVREQLLAAKNRGEAPIIVVPAAFEDPRNLGACIRTAAGLGASALLLPNKGSTGLTPTAAKAAAGAENLVPLCRARDIEKEIQGLRAEGFSVFGLDAGGSLTVAAADLTGPVVLVVGGEDRGIPPHIARGLSARLRLPMASGLHSFNASVALALLLYETARQRNFKGLSASTTT